MYTTQLATFLSKRARHLGLAVLAAAAVPAAWAQTAHPNGDLQAIDSTIVRPSGVAVDAAGNVYVTSFGTGRQNSDPPTGGVYKLTPQPDGSYVKSQINDPATPLTTPSGIAVDAVGNVYVAQGSCFSGATSCNQQTAPWPSKVVVFTPSGGTYTQSDVTTDPRAGYNTNSGQWPLVIAPAGLAVDAAGQNIFVSVYKWGPGSGPTSATVLHLCKTGASWSSTGCAQGFPRSIALNAGVALDGSGNVYFPDAGWTNSGTFPFVQYPSQLYKATPAVSTYNPTVIATPPLPASTWAAVDPLTGVAVDSAGQNLYYTLPSKQLLGLMAPPASAPPNTIAGIATLMNPANFPDTNLTGR